MRAVVCEGYGGVDLCEVREVPKPVPGDDDVLIRVEAASVNRSDWEGVVGSPAYARSGLGGLRGKARVLGTDVAGRVERIGKDVTRFQEGDEVFGDLMYHGARTFSEYAVAPERAPIALKPPGITFEQAAALPQSGVIAAQALRSRDGLRGGESILINGGGGGTGLLITQIAKRLGASVTGVDNSLKAEVMREAGADHVVDHASDDYTRQGTGHNRIIDLVGSRSILANRRALSHSGVYLLVGGPVMRLLAAVTLGQVVSAFRQRSMGMLVVRPNVADMEKMAAEVETGQVDPMIERTYPLEETAEALQRLGENRALGKLVITIR